MLRFEMLWYKYGSKLAHAIQTLRDLWEREPTAKVIIFSCVWSFFFFKVYFFHKELKLARCLNFFQGF
jgi:hypothetical protein